MKIIISVILIVNFLFTPVFAFAGEVESTADEYEDSLWHKGMMSMQDVLDNIPQAMDDLRSVAETFGQSADATISTLVNAPVKAVASSFMATASDMVDTATDALVGGRDFMSNIFIDTYNKCFVWNEETVKKGVDITRPLFEKEGLVKIDNWIKCTGHNNYFYNGVSGLGFKIDSGDIPPYYYACFVKYSDTQKFTIFATDYIYNNDDSYSYSVYYTYDGERDFDYAICNYQGQFGASKKSLYGSTSYRYSSYIFDNSMLLCGESVPSYPDWRTAYNALAGGSPSSRPVPNGKGFFRPVPQGVNKVTGSNVYNNNWGDIIVNNYTTYGDTFENTTINNYYYNGTNKDTPVYWYDIYDNNTVSIPQHDYDDLSDVTLANPDIVANHNFITDVFGAIPVVLSTLFISCLLLAIVIIFLKG